MGVVRTAIAGAERAAAAIACALMAAVMAIVSVDVAMRYVFNAPIPWVHDFVTLYAMVGIFFLSLAASYRERAHIGVDIVSERLPPAARTAIALLADSVGLVIFGLIFYYGLERSWTSFVKGETLGGIIPWPTWLSDGLVPLGSFLMILRLLLAGFAHAHALVTGVPSAAPLSHESPE